MKRLMKSNWAKIGAAVLATVSAFCVLCSLLGFMLFAAIGENGSEEESLKQVVFGNLCSNYGAEILWGGENNGGDYSRLEGGNLEYAVYRGNARIYGSNSGVSQSDYEYMVSAAEGSDYNYFIYNMLDAMMREPYISNHVSTPVTNIQRLVYESTTNLFYWDTAEGYFPVKSFYDEEWDEVTLTRSGRYYCEYKQEVFQFEEANRVYFNDVPLDLSVPQECYYDFEVISFSAEEAVAEDTDSDETVEMVVVSDDYAEMINGESYYMIDRDRIAYGSGVASQGEIYTVYMKVPRTEQNLVFANGTRDYFGEAQKLVDFLEKWRRIQNPVQAISVILFLASFIFLMAAAGQRKEDEEIHTRMVDRMPFAIYGGICCGLIILGGVASAALLSALDLLELSTLALLEVEITLAWIAIGILFCMSLSVRIKSKNFWRYTLVYYLAKPFQFLWRKCKGVFHNWVGAGVKHLGVQWLLLLAVGVLSLIEYMAVLASGGAELFLCVKALEIVAVVLILPQITKVFEGGERIASGNYEEPIDTQHMIPGLREHATNINSVGDGIANAVQERMKSEHFRTELITNVSHDIKTPLTSIINYVDLMKKEDIQDPVLLEYLEVLDRQSSRLKKLIEDLMEASKASTGNLTVNMEKCDAQVMLEQVAGEYEEKMRERQLDLVVSAPEEPMFIMADGRHLFRVYDNLMNNICKYAQPQTRVYIDLKAEEQRAVLIFRNTSRYQLNITAEELMQRFTRGDSSRNTEGNGLGLSIAESLTLLMDGKLDLFVDGDLFKVTLSFPLVKE